MKKKIFSIALALCLAFSMVPLAFADNEQSDDSLLVSDVPAETAEPTLYEFLMAAESVENMHAAITAASDEALNALTEIEINALFDRVDTLDPSGEGAETEAIVDILINLPGFVSGAEQDGEKAANDALPSGYILFDLSLGNVTITQDTYSGKAPDGSERTGAHVDTNKYYIFQGDGTTKYTSNLPSYSNVTYNGVDWGNYITNHPSKSSAKDDSVDEVIAAWENADKGTRKATSNRISIVTTGTAASGSTFNVTIDNIWSSYETSSSEGDDEGLSIKSIGTNDPNPNDKYETFDDCATNVTVNLTVKGDNRFGRIHCATHDGQNRGYYSDTNHTNIVNFSGDTTATLTSANLKENSNWAHTAALIGGTDSKDHSFKMTFDDITVYAGGARLDFGTAIGGGGNGDGRVTINGGRVTAVNSATGTAIGGGCGTAGPGGYGNVTINGGEVYAYSYKPHYIKEDSDSFTDAMPTAIGGGSSGTREGGTGIVSITGGYVYAYSEVGCAIGGGGGGNGSATSDKGEVTFYSTYGGTADVMISGDAEVDAVSGAGCAIGGGPGGGRLYPNAIPSGVNADGGTAKLTISGSPEIRSGSIGGGSPLEQNRAYGSTVGAAVVNISGGTTHGQIVMDGVIKNVSDGIVLTEGASSSFTMTGGLIDNSPISNADQGYHKYHFVEENGGAVYIHSGSATMSGGTIQDASSPLGGAIYLNGGNFTLSGTGLIQNCHTTAKDGVSDSNLGGAVYVEGGNVTIGGGKIENCYSKLGGAVYVTGDGETGGNFAMTSGIINTCVAVDEGGAVFVDGGTVVVGVEGCTGEGEEHSVSPADLAHPKLTGNTAVNGGAIAVTSGTPVIHCAGFSGNTASENGGSVYVASGGLVMNGGTIAGGTLSGGSLNAKLGGAVYVSGGEFTMNGGTLTANRAQDGGAAYVTGGSFTMDGGTVSANVASQNGGAAYVSGAGSVSGAFVMTSGVMTGNSAGVNGGGAYVTGGGVVIGDENCVGGGGNHTVAPADKPHPVITSNSAVDSGGGIAVMGDGSIVMYCGDASGNTTTDENKGRGLNVYMENGSFELYAGGNIGKATDPDLVIVGGTLYDYSQSTQEQIKLTYHHCNFASHIGSHIKDEVVDLADKVAYATKGSLFNLPDGEKYWDAPEGYRFFGWTFYGYDNESLMGEVRDKDDYLSMGGAVEALDNLDGADGDGIMMYALWAPETSTITYAGSVIGGTYKAEDLFYDEGASNDVEYNFTVGSNIVSLEAPVKAGYKFTGWYVYQNEGQNANWGDEYEPVYFDGTTKEQKGYGTLDYSKMTDQFHSVEEMSEVGGIEMGTTLFGNITLIAAFEPVYSNLTIEKAFLEGAGYSMDENQSFVFNVVGQPDDILLDPIQMTVVVHGNSSVVIEHLPVGDYTVTEVTDWSWRYSNTPAVSPAAGKVKLERLEEPKVVTFTNTRDEAKWLSGDSWCRNLFKGSTIDSAQGN